MLTTAGPVVSWKRVQGATGKLQVIWSLVSHTHCQITMQYLTLLVQAFGFCEYSNPDAGQRSIRLMNGKKIGDKALVVKVSLIL